MIEPLCAEEGDPNAREYDRDGMDRLLRRRGFATFVVLVVVAEVAGRSLTRHVDRLFSVQPVASPSTSYYPVLLVAVKISGALALAALLARGTRAWAAADAGERLLAALGQAHERRSPRLRPGLSARVWLGSFAATSVVYLLHSDAEGIASGRWPLFSPWLHTYSLPVFAGLAVVVAVAWRFASWLYEYEEYAVRTLARVRRILTAALTAATTRTKRRPTQDTAPRRRFGLAFECRPPPLQA
jgi:hypothetical protein